MCTAVLGADFPLSASWISRRIVTKEGWLVLSAMHTWWPTRNTATYPLCANALLWFKQIRQGTFLLKHVRAASLRITPCTVTNTARLFRNTDRLSLALSYHIHTLNPQWHKIWWQNFSSGISTTIDRWVKRGVLELVSKWAVLINFQRPLLQRRHPSLEVFARFVVRLGRPDCALMVLAWSVMREKLFGDILSHSYKER